MKKESVDNDTSKGKIIVVGGAGFIGGHMAVYFAKKGYNVSIVDNFSRATLLGKQEVYPGQNWSWVSSECRNVKLYKRDASIFGDMAEVISENRDDLVAIIHTAGQTAVTSSIAEPLIDMRNNFLSTFNILETVRRYADNAAVLFCSTNKVYGERPNTLPIRETDTRYEYADESFMGINEEFGVDLTAHTPYGTSKLAADLYCQDYAKIYGIKTGVFRMSCIYGPHQLSYEDQGWVTHITRRAIIEGKVKIYGNGKQVRDVLYIDDLKKVFGAFIEKPIKHGVFCIGGGKENTISIIELINKLEKILNRKIRRQFYGERKADQKIYVSDIRKAEKILGWRPSIGVDEGLKRVIEWEKSRLNKKKTET